MEKLQKSFDVFQLVKWLTQFILVAVTLEPQLF
jgi:hypothetical protein